MKKNAKEQSRSQVQTAVTLPLGSWVFTRFRELVMEAGMMTFEQVMEEERAQICGERYTHQGSSRRVYRHGRVASEVVMGGRKVKVKRPRARAVDGVEVKLPSWEKFQNEDPLDERMVEQMLIGVSTRKYDRSLEPLNETMESRSTSKSSVSRHWVEMTGKKVEELMTRNWKDMAWVALMVDGIHIGQHVMLVAIGVDEEGRKHLLGLHQGATENAAACTALLTHLRDQGMSTDRTLLVVIDGAKALAKAVRDVFGQAALIQRCQEHKIRNVQEHLPKELQQTVRKRMLNAYRSWDADLAEHQLLALAKEFDRTHPHAAGSLREGLDESLTILRLELPPNLAKTFVTTNLIENVMGSFRATARRVKRWKNGDMVLRWSAVALLEAEKNFRRIRSYRLLPRLRDALKSHNRSLNPNNKIDSSLLAA